MMIKRETVPALWSQHKTLKESKAKIALGAACNIGKNFRLLSTELEDIKEVQKKSVENYPPEIKELDDKRIELCKQFADKDEAGEPILIDFITPEGQPGKQFKMNEHRIDFETAFAELQVTYKSFLDKKDEIDKEFADFLTTETEINLMTIKSADLKNVSFTVDEAEILEPILDI